VLVGFKDAHAVIAAATVGLEVSRTFGSVVAVDPLVLDVEPGVGSETPCNFKQLLYAARAVLLAPPTPPPNPPFDPAGRKLAHAFKAV
jgi:hypothetical protein